MRKTPEEIAEFADDLDHGCLLSKYGVAIRAAKRAYEEADKYPKIVEGTWQWAIQQLREGKKVRLSTWENKWFWHMEERFVMTNLGVQAPFSLEFMDATDWKLHKEWKECTQQEAEQALLDGKKEVQAYLATANIWKDVVHKNNIVHYAGRDWDPLHHILNRKWRVRDK